MTDIKKESDIYQVRAGEVPAGTPPQWDVWQSPGLEPIASFGDKAAALNYAMCLARGRVAWHLLLRPLPPVVGHSLVKRSSTHH